MTEERSAEEKIHLALSRLNRINTIGERFSLFGQSTVNAIREKTSQAWFSVKRLFIKTAVLGSVPVPDLPEIADETNVVIPQKVTDSSVIDSELSDESEEDIINMRHTTSDTVLPEPISDTVLPEPISDTVNSAQTISDKVILQKVLMPKPLSQKPNSEITTTEMTKTFSSMETVD